MLFISCWRVTALIDGMTRYVSYCKLHQGVAGMQRFQVGGCDGERCRSNTWPLDNTGWNARRCRLFPIEHSAASMVTEKVNYPVVDGDRKFQFCHISVENKKLIRRWDSERELFYDDIVHALENAIDSCINSATDRLFVSCNAGLPKFSEITQSNCHYAVQGHSRSPIWVPIDSSYTISYLWLILTCLLYLVPFPSYGWLLVTPSELWLLCDH